MWEGENLETPESDGFVFAAITFWGCDLALAVADRTVQRRAGWFAEQSHTVSHL